MSYRGIPNWPPAWTTGNQPSGVKIRGEIGVLKVGEASCGGALPGAVCVPADLGALFAVRHSLTTARAAPTNFSQRRVQGDPAALSRVFDRFTRWQTARTGLQIINFGVLWAVVAVASQVYASGL